MYSTCSFYDMTKTKRSSKHVTFRPCYAPMHCHSVQIIYYIHRCDAAHKQKEKPDRILTSTYDDEVTKTSRSHDGQDLTWASTSKRIGEIILIPT